MDSELDSPICNRYTGILFCFLYLMSVFGIIGGVVFNKHKNGQFRITKNDPENPIN